MADIPVYESTAETVVVVTANGQATFAFDFLVLFPEQMTVFHGRGDVETVLTYPAGFSVSGLDEPNGGTVTLNLATLVNDVITMRRVTPIERLNDWQNEGDYKAALVNREQDTMFMIMQELARDAGEISPTVKGIQDAISKSRPGNVLGWDGSSKFAPLINSAAEAEVIAEEVRDLRQETFDDKEAAQQARSDASDFAGAAAGSASSANTDADRAELAAGNAFVNANVYTDVATGRAAVADGAQFQVLAGDEYVRYRRDSASTQTEVGRYPAAEALDPLQKSNDTLLFGVSDDDGNLAVAIRSPLDVASDGSLNTENIDAGSHTSARWLYAHSDTNGNVLFGVDDAGVFRANFEGGYSESGYKTGGLYDFEVNHVFAYGQSLSVGQASPLLSSTAMYDSLMFYRGMRPQYDYPSEDAADWYQSLVPAVEQTSTTNTALRETPSRGTADAIKERILAEDGKAYTDHTYQIMLSAPGYGATTIAQLSKGTAHYNRMIEQAAAAKTLANAQGKTYAVQAVTWTQGESDYISGTSYADYLSRLNALVADVNADIKSEIGQAKDIKFISYQVATHLVDGAPDGPNIALAQLECAENNPLFHIATPVYHLPYQDNRHLTGIGSKWLGAYYGIVYKRIVINQEDWSPVRPIASIVQGPIAEVRFHVPKGRLVFDTDGVPARPDMGFELVDGSGNPLAISSVSITDFDRVKIVASSPLPAGTRLRYAWSGASNVGQGNLRDTQGDTIQFDPEGLNLPMHNWCVIFEKEL